MWRGLVCKSNIPIWHPKFHISWGLKLLESTREQFGNTLHRNLLLLLISSSVDVCISLFMYKSLAEVNCHGCSAENRSKILLSLRQLHWVSMVRAGSDEHPVRTMETRVVPTRLDLLGGPHSVVIRITETSGLHLFALFKEVFGFGGRNLCRTSPMGFIAAEFCNKNGL